MSNRLSVSTTLLTFALGEVKLALVALTPRSDAKGIHIPIMFIPNGMNISVNNVNTGFSFYYGSGHKEWQYNSADALYYRTIKATLTDEQREEAKQTLIKLVKSIITGNVEPEPKAEPTPRGEFEFEIA